MLSPRPPWEGKAEALPLNAWWTLPMVRTTPLQAWMS